jgi:hypothetical protein
MRKGTPEVFLVAALALSVGNAAAIPYTFTNIADSSGPFAEFGFWPALNNRGTVAFPARLDISGEGIFTGRGGPITTIPDSIGRGAGPPSINDSGMVAFSTGGEIVTSKGGHTTTLYMVESFGGLVSLNNHGTVAFAAFGPECCLFTGSGGPTTKIMEGVTVPGVFDLNDSGTVAFRDFGVYTGSGGPITTIIDDFSCCGGVSINNSGTVAFTSDLGPVGTGVYTGSGGPITTIVDTTGPFEFFRFHISLNNRGTVAFRGVLDEGGQGIFTGPDPLADEVISIGDTLLGSTLVDFQIGKEALNDTGQLAFLYELADGRRGVARADPLPIPEPGTLPLVLVTGLVAAIVAQRSPKRCSKST